jgi:hypothetical protein
MCQDHWDRLREAIDKRGLSSLVAESGQEAATKMEREIEEGVTIDTFEPLMSAHNSILVNTMRLIEDAGGSPLYLILGGDIPEDPVQGYPGFEGRTWPRCPLCYAGLAHEVSCDGCDLPQVNGYDWMIDRAADDALERWQSLRP